MHPNVNLTADEWNWVQNWQKTKIVRLLFRSPRCIFCSRVSTGGDTYVSKVHPIHPVSAFTAEFSHQRSLHDPIHDLREDVCADGTVVRSSQIQYCTSHLLEKLCREKKSIVLIEAVMVTITITTNLRTQKWSRTILLPNVRTRKTTPPHLVMYGTLTPASELVMISHLTNRTWRDQKSVRCVVGVLGRCTHHALMACVQYGAAVKYTSVYSGARAWVERSRAVRPYLKAVCYVLYAGL
jgi:hypothetical protein